MRALAILALPLLLFTQLASAQQPVTLYLNWRPGPEHAPLFYAQKAGLYAKAGVEVAIEPGTGSGNTVRLVSNNPHSMGVADFQSVLAARSRGTDVVAVMNLFANSPYTFYWRKSSGIRSIKDFAGRKIGAEARDPARLLWRALAQRNGIDPDSVTWVDVPNNEKVDALRSGTIDITVNAFPDSYSLYPKAFGDDLAQLAWRDAGLNLYNLSLIALSTVTRDNPQLVAAVVTATQQAEAACLADAGPCIDALTEAYPTLKREEELANWKWTAPLFQSAQQAALPLGAFDSSRVRDDYKVARELQKLDPSFNPMSATDNHFLGPMQQ